MISSAPKILQSELSGRLQSLMLLRVIFVSLFLGASIFIQVRETQAYFGYIQTSHYLLIAVVYFLTFIYALVLKYSKSLFWFAYLQVLFDTFFVTAVVYSTGGIESIFSSLYFLCIIYGSIMLYRKGGMMVASLSSILYGLLLDLHYYEVIHPLGSRMSHPEQYQSSYLLYIILVNIVAFYVVAFLSSYVSEQARKSNVELKAKQIDLDKLEILNESIINSITSGLIALDGSNRIILFNPAAEEIFQIKANKAFGRQVHDVLPFLSEHLADGRGAVSPLVENEDFPPFLDIPYLRPNDENKHLRLSISPLRLLLAGQEGHILVFQDLTEIKQIEEEMKRVEGLAVIGELAAKIAHEIRNPMASISGSIQMLKGGLEKDDINSRLMEIVSREVERLNNLVNDFLVFARPKKGNLKKFDLNQLILESLELFKNSRHYNDDIKLLTDFQDSINVESDPEQIKQVLWNLFLNACEAMAEGGSLYVSTRSEEETQPDGRKIKISIRDTGKGFEKNALSQLFVPFFTTKEDGSGLGLAIVKGLVEGLKGEVFGSNHPEGGAEISISIPVHPLHSGE
jgi:two-component system sensor histidine kinase PilS (NtrC family)